LSIDQWPLDASQVDPRAVAPDLGMIRRIALGERGDETEFAGKERA
jgi:hypothetical protein